MTSALTQIQGLESKDQKKLREQHAISNKFLVNTLLTPVDNVWSAKGGAIKVDAKSDALKDNIKESIQDVNKGLDIQEYLKNIYTDNLITDPNGLMFNEIDEEGNTQYDSSFFVITRYNGIEYSYTIYNGEESPEIQLMNEASTKKKNGTEIRIPIEADDLYRFESEVTRQLFYFENIVYRGFDSDETLNDYRLFKGDSFIYRVNTYSDYVHVCLVKVAYPIDYSALGLSSYDHQIPIAMQFDIGDLNVTVSRESLEYSEENIKFVGLCSRPL